MLALSRKNRERVRLKLGDLVIWVEVLGVEGGCVRLGFHAPLEVLIHREEVAGLADVRLAAAEEAKTG